MKPKMFMLVGLPGSGKSTLARNLAMRHDVNIHSSDAIREELSGDVNNQNINELVFKTLHSRIKEDLRKGKNCIYDATNISYKKRMSFLQELKNINCEKVCIFMATPFSTCLHFNFERERVVPQEVIERMYRQFDPPVYYEGWDRIEVKYYCNPSFSAISHTEWMERYMSYDQENHHHSESLGRHAFRVYTKMKEIYPYLIFDNEIHAAAALHDCGKPFAKVFKDSKGNDSKEAHYYNHEHIGAYDSFFYRTTGDALYIALLIRWHMQPYFWEKDNNEKQHNKYRKLWGEELYHHIMALHYADKEAH